MGRGRRASLLAASCALCAALTLAFAAAAGAASPELEATGSMLAEHQQPLAAPLPGGKVLIASGNEWKSPYEMESYPTTKAEVYDPVSGTFTETGHVLKGRFAGAAAALPSGEVLIAGGLYAHESGTELKEVELYDPTTGVFSSTGSLSSPRWANFAVTLASGQVLVGDGWKRSGATSVISPTTELYDTVSGQFEAGPTLSTARLEPAAALLPDGKVLIAGGSTGGEPVSTSEILDPCTGLSTPGPNLLTPGFATATSLTNGRVLISIQRRENLKGVSELEEYDPVAGEFLATGIASNSIYRAALAPLEGGRALVAGRPGPAEESAAARQAFVFSGVEAPAVVAVPTCGGSEVAPPQSGPGPPALNPGSVRTMPTSAASTAGSASTSPAPPTSASPPAKGVSAARAEGGRQKHRARRQRRHHHHGHRHAHRKHPRGQHRPSV